MCASQVIATVLRTQEQDSSSKYMPGEPSHRRPLRAVAILLAGATLIVICGVGLYGWSMRRAVQRIDAKRATLLTETDHSALLVACRHAIGAFRDERRPPGNEYLQLSGDDPRLPAELRRLHANYIMIAPDSIHVELGGGHFHYGLDAVADGATDLEDYLDSLPDRRLLVRGLWYYED